MSEAPVESSSKSCSRKILGWLAAACVVVICLAAFQRSQNPAQPTVPGTQNTPDLIVPEDRLTFGEAWEHKNFTLTLPITNRSRSTLDIRSFSVTCGCLTVEPPGLHLRAGETRDVRLHLDLTQNPLKASIGELRPFKAALSPVLASRRQPKIAVHRWEISGKVRSAFRVEPELVDLGRHSELSQPLEPRTILVYSYVSLTSLKAGSNSTQFRTILEPYTNGSGDYRLHDYRLQLLASEKLPVGPIALRVELVADVPGSRPPPPRVIPVIGQILPDVQASPQGLLLGALALGEAAEDTITLHSLTHSPFELLDFRVEGNGLVVKELTSPLSGGPAFQVTQTATDVDDRSTKVVFRIRPATGIPTELPVIVSYRGVP